MSYRVYSDAETRRAVALRLRGLSSSEVDAALDRPRDSSQRRLKRLSETAAERERRLERARQWRRNNPGQS